MAVVTITSPANFEEISPDGFGSCCGMVPKVERVTTATSRRRKEAWVVVHCFNPDCEFHEDESGVFDSEGDIARKWERYRHAETV